MNDKQEYVDLCFACGKRLSDNPYLADTRDDQIVYIGSECYKRVRIAGEAGYQPPLGGPRLYLCPKGVKYPDGWHVSARSLKKSL